MEKLHTTSPNSPKKPGLHEFSRFDISPGSAEIVLDEYEVIDEEDTSEKKSLLLEGEDLDELHYTILTGHRKENGEWKSDEELRRQYVMLTDKLIGRIDGTLEDTPPYDAVLYLDKSARPVAWLVNELWDALAREKGTSFDEAKVPPKPQTLFLNIDREQWLPTVDPHRNGNIDINAIHPEVIKSLRSIYQRESVESDGATSLDGKRILVVDEVSVSGDTLRIAKAILEKAVPEAHFDTAHWMMPETVSDKRGNKRNNDIPVWYKQHDHTGRLVGNRDVNRSSDSKSRVQRIGQFFLSTRFPELDMKAVTLKNEFRKLARDVKNKKIQFTPAPLREPDDFDARRKKYNQ